MLSGTPAANYLDVGSARHRVKESANGLSNKGRHEDELIVTNKSDEDW